MHQIGLSADWIARSADSIALDDRRIASIGNTTAYASDRTACTGDCAGRYADHAAMKR